jgi:ATP-binding cassette, subfamily B, bacterial
LSDYLALRFKNLSDKYYIQSKKLAKQRAAWGSFFNVIGTAAYYGAYVFIIFRTVAGIFSLGDLTFLSGSFNRLRSKLQGFFTRFTQITESALYLQDYFEFLDLKYSDEEEGEEKLPLPEKIVKGFEFRDVGFQISKI